MTETLTQKAPTAVELTFHSTCTCRYCPECMTYYANWDYCENCGNNDVELQPTCSCDGYCYELEMEYFNSLLDQWRENNPALHELEAYEAIAKKEGLELFELSQSDVEGMYGYRIHGQHMGWRSLTGYSDIKNPDDLTAETLTSRISGEANDWTQQWSIDTSKGGTLTASQSHHDAMNEQFQVVVLSV